MSGLERDRRRRWLALGRVGNAVGYRAAERFITRDGAPGTNLEEAFAHPEGLMREPGGGVDWEDLVRTARGQLDRAEEEMVRAERVGARVIDVEDAEYPIRLRVIADAPVALFVLGRLESCDARAVAVVGARASTRFGAEMTRRIVTPLAACHVTIVSGMAMGIDAHAHRRALESGARTVAVLGTGIDVCYPSNSRDLYEAIPRRGAIVSESAPGTLGMPWVFKPRNRIVSALSKAVVVVEARHKSGALNTAWHARAQGRDLYAVPGDPDLARSEGTNTLLAEGAIVARSGADVLDHSLDELYRHDDVKTVVRPEMLDPSQAKVRDILGDEPIAVDAIALRAGMPVARLLATLSGLERAGIVKRDDRGRYARFGKTTASG